MTASEIRVIPMLTREQMGSCDGCIRQDYQFVTLIELRSLSFRVCDKCRARLFCLLGAAKDEPLEARTFFKEKR